MAPFALANFKSLLWLATMVTQLQAAYRASLSKLCGKYQLECARPEFLWQVAGHWLSCPPLAEAR